MSTHSRPPLRLAPGAAPEPSLREVLASLGIESTFEERKRKRSEAAARRRAALEASPPVTSKADPQTTACR